MPLQDVLIGIPYQGKYKEIFNSDDIKFGGNNHVNNRIKFSYPREADGRDYSIKIQIGALSFAIFSCKEVQNS